MADHGMGQPGERLQDMSWDSQWRNGRSGRLLEASKKHLGAASARIVPFAQAMDKDPDNDTPAEVFYELVKKLGAPLLESSTSATPSASEKSAPWPVSGSTEESRRTVLKTYTVTFVFRLEDDISYDTVLVDCACTWDGKPSPMRRLGKSSIFYSSFRLRSDARLVYRFGLTSSSAPVETPVIYVVDPLNPEVFSHMPDDEYNIKGEVFSVLELPDAPTDHTRRSAPQPKDADELPRPRRYGGPKEVGRKGRLVLEAMESEVNGRKYRRRLYIYVPNEIHTAGGDHAPSQSEASDPVAPTIAVPTTTATAGAKGAPLAGITGPDNGKRFPLVLFLSGADYLLRGRAQEILDLLIEQGKIQPVVVAFLDTLRVVEGDGTVVMSECELLPGDEFSTYVSTRLLPYLTKRYRLSVNPDDRVIAGFGIGAVVAAFVGLQKPDVFRTVICQSGCFWWPHKDDDVYGPTAGADQEQSGVREGEALSRLVSMVTHRTQTTFFIDVGLLEDGGGDRVLYPSQLAANRHLRDVLRAADYRVIYTEYNGGHSFLNWRVCLYRALATFFSETNEVETAVDEGFWNTGVPLFNRLYDLLMGE